MWMKDRSRLSPFFCLPFCSAMSIFEMSFASCEMPSRLLAVYFCGLTETAVFGVAHSRHSFRAILPILAFVVRVATPSSKSCENKKGDFSTKFTEIYVTWLSRNSTRFCIWRFDLRFSFERWRDNTMPAFVWPKYFSRIILLYNHRQQQI